MFSPNTDERDHAETNYRTPKRRSNILKTTPSSYDALAEARQVAPILGDYLPRKCGIASLHALRGENAPLNAFAIALEGQREIGRATSAVKIAKTV